MRKISISFLAGCIITCGLFLFIGSNDPNNFSLPKSTNSKNLSLNQLLFMPEQELEQIDIGLMNLICAEGLNGSEDLDINQCFSTLDDWADQIRKDTQLRLLSFRQDPAKYDHSENLFKVVNMVLYLKNQIGVDYNQEIMQRDKFPDSRDVFIHGCLTGPKRGGCVSIPVLCVSVGRRLGYPLKLVLAKRHVFFRWDDGKEVFNMEACCPGCDSRPDEYYKAWPDKISDQEIQTNRLLKSLTPPEELALLLETRGHCLFDMGKAAEAQIMYAYAYKLMPTQVKLTYFDQVTRSEFEKIKKR
jgi:hypothetical protein